MAMAVVPVCPLRQTPSDPLPEVTVVVLCAFLTACFASTRDSLLQTGLRQLPNATNIFPL